MIVTNNERLFGYARISTTDQELNLQVDSLLAQGVDKHRLFCDKISGTRADRPGLVACNAELRSGDTLVVWRLDRLGRSMRHLVIRIEDLKERGIGFRSISDGMIDTTSAVRHELGDRLCQLCRKLVVSGIVPFEEGILTRLTFTPSLLRSM